ncbi:MAG: Uma2 family endonuclease [Synechococcaceae cyanobacterium SM2_3_1]|nr:Uma2 family endonuclease [Synechococcaceae cyanobacterium SM2_3_1]
MPTLQQEVDREPIPHLWTREEYYRMADFGFFRNKRVELIEGQVVEMSPMKSPHATGVELVAAALRQVLGSGVFVREQKPLVLSELSEPEPDVAVVSGSIRDYAKDHPRTALLVVEVSDSTLRFDRQTKSGLYAEAAVREYWILNLGDRCLEVYRSPEQVADTVDKFQYREKIIYTPEDRVSSLIFPESRIAVIDLLP